jgi:EmrB/QacA subfamily drug resistance transporter
MSPPLSPARARRLALTAVLLGTLTVSLNNTALNPALPTFMVAFRINALSASWIITAFLLGMGLTMPVTGWLGQRLGKKPLYLSGLALFLAGSAVGALAPSLPWVIAARATQGVAGGLMIPLGLPLVFEVYPRDQRGRIGGLWAMVVMLAPAVGPVVGGLVVQYFHWHTLFLINVPLGVLAALIGRRHLPAATVKVRRPFDWPGFVLVTSAVGTLLVALGRLTELAALSRPANLVLLGAALGSLALFVRVELRTPAPLLDLRLFAVGSYGLSAVVMVVQSVGMFGTLVLVPVLLQAVMGQGASWTGVALFATALTTGAFAKLGGTLLDVRGPRGVVTAGLLVSALATLALGVSSAGAGLIGILLLMIARGIGLGLSYFPATTAGLSAVPEPLTTQGAAMNNVLRRVAASAAVVLVSLFFDVRRAGLMAAGQGGMESSRTAIEEIFLAMGTLILLTVPLALMLPGADRHRDRTDAQAAAA